MIQRVRQGPVAVCWFGVAVTLWLCSTQALGNPVVDILDAKLTERQRLRALDTLREDLSSGKADRSAARDALKRVVWRNGDPGALRIQAIETLAADTDPAAVADTVNLLRLRLATETNWDVIGKICTLATERGWREITPGLVRSYARAVLQPADDERPERAALLALHSGKDLVEIVYDVFASPAGGEGITRELNEKVRTDAWELLSRLDSSGSRRAQLLAGSAKAVPGDPVFADLSATARELGVVPVTGSELDWVRGLRSGKDPAQGAWWTESQAAVARLNAEQRQGLALRHVEPVRWAARFEVSWLGMGREELLKMLQGGLEERRVYGRRAEHTDAAPPASERLTDWTEELTWGDALALLVVDRAIRDPKVLAALQEQIAIDIRDTSTEYGGVLVADAQGGFNAVSYPPRATQRINDTTFQASEDMFANSGTSPAHYHFHAQRWDNRDYAGPGPADMEYARKHGRTCVVFTPMRRGSLNADVYVRSGAIVDLGELELSR